MVSNTNRGSVVYRLEETLQDDAQIVFAKGVILSHETMQDLIEAGWFEIKVTVIVLQ